MKKNLKYFFVSTIFLLVHFYSYSQVFYYSQGKKIVLQEDTLKLFIKYKTSNLNPFYANNILKIAGVKSFDSTSTKSVVVLTLDPSVKRDKILKQVKQDSNVLYASESLLLGDLPFITTGEILLKPTDSTNISSILNKLNLQNQVSVSNKRYYDMIVLEAFDQEKVFTIADSIYESGLVKWCHPNFFVPITNYTNDPLYAQQYYLRNTGQYGGVAGIDINIEGAWNITQGNAAIRVAVIDDGVENHEDLNGRVLLGFTPRNVNGNGAPINTSAHGEACAGIIAATQNNNIGIAGIAPLCNIVPINIFYGGETTADVANGINWAWNQGQASVLSNSWGYITSSQTQPGFDVIIQAITNARTQGRSGKGSIVVFASGNNYGNGVNDVSFPANVNGVITVGACNNTPPSGDIWYYSERGASMDLVAPSGDVNLLGDVTTTDRMGAAGYEPGNYTSRFGGTSAACPQVSGIAALMLSLNPNLTENQVTGMLQTTATDMGTTGFDNTFGYGRANGCAAVRQAFSTLSIAGNNSLCSGTSQYSIAGVLPTANISWTSSNTNIATVTPTGNPTTVTKVGNGNVTITATLNACGGNQAISKTIRVGTYTTSEYNITQYPNTIYLGNTVQFGMPWYYYPPESGTTYNWYWDGSLDYISGQGTSVVTLGTSRVIQGQTPWVIGRANNSCGTGPMSPAKYLSYYHLGSFTVTPNPATTEINIQPDMASLNTSVKPNIIQVELIDKMGSISLIKQFGKGISNVNISVAQLRNDIYVLRIFDGNNWYSQKLIVQH
jgi:hypothetical protein